ncbi:OmpP1/FadL family transporter [Roseivirga echinicomitans]
MKLGIKLIMVSLGVVCLFQTSQAQIQQGSYGYYNDALRYSQLQNPGTARFSGMAGAGSVLGGDISSAIYNPAGLGVFNRSQFTFTPGFYSLQTEGESFGTTNKDEATKFSIANLGVVINFNKGDLIPGSFRGGSLAITYNRINNFSRNVLSQGNNGNNSIIDNMLQQADGLFPDEINGISQTGYDHYIINPDPNDETLYHSPILGFPTQTETIRTKGYTDQVNIAYGTNFDDKLYLGAGMGITTASYANSRIYTETFTNEPLSSFTIDERLELNGTGINFNIGAIVRPMDMLRVGLSYTSPTYYNFNEEGDNIYNSEWNNYDVSTFRDNQGNRLILEDTVLNSLQTATDVFVSTFNLKTPSRLNAGVAFFFNKNGFITADIEHLNYANANISSNDFFTGSDNTTIENIYNSATNIKLGGEYRYEMFRLRAGYAHFGDPYQSKFDGVDLDRSRNMISGGVGINLGKYFFDLAIVNTKYDESFRSYRMAVLEDSPLTIIKHNMTNAKLTFGMNF